MWYIYYKGGHEPFENEIKMKTPHPETHIYNKHITYIYIYI